MTARGMLRGAALALLAQCLVLAPAPPSAAAEIDARLALLEACRQRARGGDREGAEACLRERARATETPWVAAEAYWELGQPSEANRWFRRAAELEPRNPYVRVRWAELYRSTHQGAEARRLFEEALAIDPELFEAKLGLVRLATDELGLGTEAAVAELIGDYPDRPEPRLLRVRLALEAGEVEVARDELAGLDKRFESDFETSLESQAADCGVIALEVFALRAALAQVESRSGEVVASEWTRRSLACAPRSGEIYATPAHFLVMLRRYTEAIRVLEAAVEVEPELWSAHTELAMQLMRTNRLDEARSHLETAYAGDPFSPEVVNSLRLLDRLDAYRTLEVDVELPAADDGEGSTARTARLILRLDPDEAELLAPYVQRLTRDAIARFEKRYAYRLEQPVVIEMYPDHDDFAVRSVGMPGLGLLGATFGNLVAMDSPSGRRREEEFHWGSVLWHELAHVFTLEASAHRVPRWFSEGVSVYEEWATGPARQPALSLDFIAALREGRLLPVADLDQGFQRPSWPGQVAVSYLQAGLVCEYLAQEIGQQGLAALLVGYRNGGTTEELLQRATGRSLDALDAALLAFARQRAGPLVEAEADWRRALDEAREAAAAGVWERVLASSERLRALRPEDVGTTSAYLLRASAYRATGERAALQRELSTYWTRGGRDPVVLRELAELAGTGGEPETALAVLESLVFVDPLDERLHADLGRAYVAAGQLEAAREELELWAAQRPLDQVGVHFELAKVYRELGQPDLARRHVLYALEVAPEFRPGLELLLEVRP